MAKRENKNCEIKANEMTKTGSVQTLKNTKTANG